MPRPSGFRVKIYKGFGLAKVWGAFLEFSFRAQFRQVRHRVKLQWSLQTSRVSGFDQAFSHEGLARPVHAVNSNNPVFVLRNMFSNPLEKVCASVGWLHYTRIQHQQKEPKDTTEHPSAWTWNILLEDHPWEPNRTTSQIFQCTGLKQYPRNHY